MSGPIPWSSTEEIRPGQWHLQGLTPARWDGPCTSANVSRSSPTAPSLWKLFLWVLFDFQMTSIMALKRARPAPGYPQAALELFSPKPRVCFESSCWPGCQEMGSERSIPFSGRQGCVPLARQGLGPLETYRSRHGHIWTGPRWARSRFWDRFPL